MPARYFPEMVAALHQLQPTRFVLDGELAIPRNTRLVGSLLLGLYNGAGKLDHVGFTATLRDLDRTALTGQLEALVMPLGFTGNAPGGPSRWSTERSAEWQPLRPELAVEVSYDHVTGDRFRHGAKFLRWRPNKAPRQCTFDQLEPVMSRLPAAVTEAGGSLRSRHR